MSTCSLKLPMLNVFFDLKHEQFELNMQYLNFNLSS